MGRGTLSDEPSSKGQLQTLLRACARTIDRVPSCDEFIAWREWRQARGGGDQLPLASVYVERYGDWDGALAAAGFRDVPLVRPAVSDEQRYLRTVLSTLPPALQSR
jgi:hypothetical protein